MTSQDSELEKAKDLSLLDLSLGGNLEEGDNDVNNSFISSVPSMNWQHLKLYSLPFKALNELKIQLVDALVSVLTSYHLRCTLKRHQGEEQLVSPSEIT